MKKLRKVMGAINTAVFAVLNFIFFVRPGSQQADWPGNDASVGTSLEGVHKAHVEFGKKLQADRDERRRRAQDRYIGYNW